MATLNFRQGIVRYQTDANNNPTFLNVNSSSVDLIVSPDPTSITFIHGNTDYIYTETSTVIDAWSELPNSTVWLYWELDLVTGDVSRNWTDLEPSTDTARPVNPAVGQMWFSDVANTWTEWNGSRYVTVIRVLAAQLVGGLTPLSVSSNTPLFHGTQVGITGQRRKVGSLVFGSNGKPIRNTGDDTLFTTEDSFTTGVPTSSSHKLSNTVITGRAAMSLAAYSVVQYGDFDELTAANPAFVGVRVLGIIEDDAPVGEVVNFISEGMIFNEAWDWIAEGASVNDPLYVDATGQLTTANTFAQSTPVGAIVGQQEILFAPRLFINVTNGGFRAAAEEGTGLTTEQAADLEATVMRSQETQSTVSTIVMNALPALSEADDLAAEAVATLGTTLEATQSDVADLETNLTTSNEAIAALEATAATLADEGTARAAAIADVASSVADLETAQAELTTTATESADAVAGFESDIDDARADITTNRNAITGLQSADSLAATQLAALGTTVADNFTALSGQVTSTNDELDNLEADILLVQTDVEAVTTAQGEVESDVDDLTTAVDAAGGRITSLETGASGVAADIAGLNDSNTQATDRLDGLDTAVADNTTAITNNATTTSESFSELETTITTIQADITALEAGDGGALAGRVDDNEAAITTTNSAITTIQADITALEAGDGGALAGRVSTNETDIETIQTNIEALEAGDGGALTTRVTTAESDIDALETSVSSLESDSAAVTQRVTDAEANVTATQTSITAIRSDITALEAGDGGALAGRVTDNEADIAQLTTAVDELSSGDSAESVGLRVDALETDVSAAQLSLGTLSDRVTTNETSSSDNATAIVDLLGEQPDPTVFTKFVFQPNGSTDAILQHIRNRTLRGDNPSVIAIVGAPEEFSTDINFSQLTSINIPVGETVLVTLLGNNTGTSNTGNLITLAVNATNTNGDGTLMFSISETERFSADIGATDVADIDSNTTITPLNDATVLSMGLGLADSFTAVPSTIPTVSEIANDVDEIQAELEMIPDPTILIEQVSGVVDPDSVLFDIVFTEAGGFIGSTGQGVQLNATKGTIAAVVGGTTLDNFDLTRITNIEIPLTETRVVHLIGNNVLGAGVVALAIQVSNNINGGISVSSGTSRDDFFWDSVDDFELVDSNTPGEDLPGVAFIFSQGAGALFQPEAITTNVDLATRVRELEAIVQQFINTSR